MTDKRWFLGASLSSEPLEVAKNFIAREINHYIFKSHWEGTLLCAEALKNMVMSQREVEENALIASGQLYDCSLKWSIIQGLLS